MTKINQSEVVATNLSPYYSLTNLCFIKLLEKWYRKNEAGSFFHIYKQFVYNWMKYTKMDSIL